jgi:hypothetical protein
MDAASASVLGDGFTHSGGKSGIPRSGESDASGVGGVGPPGADALGTVAHFEHGKAGGGLGADEHVVETTDEFEFLLERQFGDHRIDLLLNRRTVGNRSLGQDRKRESAAQESDSSANRLNAQENILKPAPTSLAEPCGFVKPKWALRPLLVWEERGSVVT